MKEVLAEAKGPVSHDVLQRIMTTRADAAEAIPLLQNPANRSVRDLVWVITSSWRPRDSISAGTRGRDPSGSLRPAQDRNDGAGGLVHLAVTNAACCVKYDPGIGGEQSIGPNAAWLIQPTVGEICRFKPDGVFVGLGLAGNLAKDDVVTAEGRKDQCRGAFRLGQVGEWKLQDYNVASYKSAQAPSSSGESQSFIREDSASNAGAQ